MLSPIVHKSRTHEALVGNERSDHLRLAARELARNVIERRTIGPLDDDMLGEPISLAVISPVTAQRSTLESIHDEKLARFRQSRDPRKQPLSAPATDSGSSWSTSNHLVVRCPFSANGPNL